MKMKMNYKDIAAAVVKDFEDITDLDIGYLLSEPKNRKETQTTMKQARFDLGTEAIFFCECCCDDKKGEYARVVVGICKSKDEGEDKVDQMLHAHY
jgi:hypothetical protein